MLRIETKTKLSKDDVMKRALKFFSDQRMNLVTQSPDGAIFEGAGGDVSFSISTQDGLTAIEFISREWDKQVKDFIELLPKKVIDKEDKKAKEDAKFMSNLGSDTPPEKRL